MSKELHVKNFKQLMKKDAGMSAKEYEQKYSHMNNVMTVKDLKDILSTVEDDSIPITISVFEDSCSADLFPLLQGNEIESGDDEYTSKTFELSTVCAKHYKEWKKEQDID